MHPLNHLALGYVGGLLADALPGGSALLPAIVLGLWGAALWVWRAGRPRERAAALLLTGAGALGAIAVPALHRWALPSHHLLRHIPHERANVVGHVALPLERREGPRPRLAIEVERLVIRGVEVPSRGRVRITLAAPPREAFEVGDRVLVRRVRLGPPRRYLNPGGFDYREFLRLRSVHAVGFASPRALERLAPREQSAWWRGLFGLRDRMRDHLRAALAPEAAGLLEAMTLGVREDLDREVRAAFQVTGTAHLLAISGLHVGFITAFFYGVLLLLFRRLPPPAFPARPVVLTPAKAASLAAIPIVVLFALLTGARVSTVRATIMVVVYLLARVLERAGGALHSVLLAALIILVLEPGFIWDAAFQLSFVAVTAIILAARRIPRPGARRSLWEGAWWRACLLQFACIQVVVMVAVAPLTAWHFHEAHPVGLLANFLLIPIASLAVPVTFLVASFAALPLPGVGGLLAPADGFLALLAGAMIGLARLASAVPGGTLVVSPPGPFLLAGAFASLALALAARRAAWRRAGWAAIGVALLWILLPARAPEPAGRTTLLLPDAGRADAFFLRLPDGRGFAVDGGGAPAGGFDTWGNVLGPLLRHLGETSWEALLTLAEEGPASPAARELAEGMGLRRVVRIGRDLPPGGRGPHPVWEASLPPARLRLLRWPGGAAALEVEHGAARWLLMAGSAGAGFDPGALAGRGYELVRLPEALLREGGVLDWLERERPRALFAAPGRGARLAPEAWRRLRARQEALGVYRPWRSGMARVTTDGRPLGRGGRMERYAMAGAWPHPSPGGWVALRPAEPSPQAGAEEEGP